MFTIINNFNGRTAESFKMGKDAFIEAHKGKVIDVEKVWKQVEKDAQKNSQGMTTDEFIDAIKESLAKKPKAKAKTK